MFFHVRLFNKGGLFLFQSIGKRQKDLVDKKGVKHPFRRPESAHKASLSE